MCSPNVNDFWFISLIQFTFNDTVCSQTNQSHWCTSSGTASNLVRLGVPIRGASLLIGRMLLSICTGQPWLFTLGRINSVPWVGQWLSPWLTTCWPPHCPAWSRTEVISCVATQCMLPTAPLLWWWLFVALATVVMSGRDRHSNVQWMTAVAKNDTDPGRPLIFGAQCILWLWMVQWLMKVRQTNETWEHVTVFVWLGINMSWWQWLNEWKWESNFKGLLALVQSVTIRPCWFTICDMAWRPGFPLSKATLPPPPKLVAHTHPSRPPVAKLGGFAKLGQPPTAPVPAASVSALVPFVPPGPAHPTPAPAVTHGSIPGFHLSNFDFCFP